MDEEMRSPDPRFAELEALRGRWRLRREAASTEYHEGRAPTQHDGAPAGIEAGAVDRGVVLGPGYEYFDNGQPIGLGYARSRMAMYQNEDGLWMSPAPERDDSVIHGPSATTLTKMLYDRDPVTRANASVWISGADAIIARDTVALENNPEDAEAHLRLAIAYWQKGGVDASINHLAGAQSIPEASAILDSWRGTQIR